MIVIPMSTTSLWSPDQAYNHLKATFESACKLDPGLMESYMAMAVAAVDRTEEIAIMREGLRSTVKERYPFELLVR